MAILQFKGTPDRPFIVACLFVQFKGTPDRPFLVACLFSVRFYPFPSKYPARVFYSSLPSHSPGPKSIIAADRYFEF